MSIQTAPKPERFNLRATARQAELLRNAAAASDTSVTEFILSNAVAEAERRLADRRIFLLGEEEFAEFEAMLDAPVDLTKLAQLLSEDSPFGSEIEPK